MNERQGGHNGPDQEELSSQRNASQKEQADPQKEVPANESLVSLVEQKILDRLNFTPNGEDPAFWPIYVLAELNYSIVMKEEIKKNSGASPYAAVGKIAAPMKETLRNVNRAYEIIAYPHCQQERRRDCIEGDLEIDRQLFGRDQVELNDTELRMLGKITAARGIPFNPQKRIYDYSEVPISPGVNPLGMRHMTTDEIRKTLTKNPWKIINNK